MIPIHRTFFEISYAMQHSCPDAADRRGAEAGFLRRHGIAARLLPTPAEAFPMWLIDADQSRPEPVESLLSPAERARASRYKTEALRDRYIVAHGGLRVILHEIYDVEMRARDLPQNEYGKPFLPSAPHLHFSISYSAGHVMIGVNEGDEIGVDIEAMRAIPDAAELAELHFTAKERAEIATKSELSRSFLNIWVRKEACVKASGRGLGIPLTELECGGGGEITTVRLTDGRCYRSGIIQYRGDPILGWARNSAEL